MAAIGLTRRQASPAPRLQCGQALTGMAILAAVLVPLFVLIPMLGRYRHLQQVAPQVARGAAGDPPCDQWWLTVSSNQFARYSRQTGLKLVGAGLAVALQLPLSSCSAENQVSADRSGVTWQGLELGDFSASAIDGWRAALSEPWMLGGEAIHFTVGDGSDRRKVETCEQLFAATELNLHVQGPDRGVLRGWRAKCKAVRAVVEGITAQTSFIDDFSLDPASVKALPVEMAFIVSRDDKARVEQVRSASGTLGDLLGDATVTPVSASAGGAVQVRNESTGKRRYLTVLARGDFDHDGFDDLLLYASGSMARGTYSTSSVYIVSRLKIGGALVLRDEL